MFSLVLIGGSPLVGLWICLLIATIVTLIDEGGLSLGVFFTWLAFWAIALIGIHSLI